MPPGKSIREQVIEAVSSKPSHLQSIYSFILRFRPETAKETIRARVYEAVADGSVRRLAPGVYLATRGKASLLLVEGDAREVLRSLDDESLDAILTDPPYDLGTKKHAQTGTTRPHKGKGRTYEQWDLDRHTLGEMFRVLRKDKQWNTLNREKREREEYPRGGGALLLFVPPLTRSSWRHIFELVELAESLGFVFYGSFTWDQEIMGMGYDAGRNRKNEVLFFTAGKRNGVLWDLGLPNVLRHKRLSRRKGEHEAEKPVDLFWDLARAVTRGGDVVADFFVGRGRWIQKFLEEGRHVVAVDRDPGWVAKIKGDFAQLRL
jgi:site-specific DNA-methyltransferase (adenine-specific)